MPRRKRIKASNTEPKLIEIRDRQHMDGWSKTADEWIQYFKEMKEANKEHEKLGKVTYVIESFDMPYDDRRYPDLFSVYWRKETDKELRDRLSHDSRMVEWRKEQFRRLKQEFEPE